MKNYPGFLDELTTLMEGVQNCLFLSFSKYEKMRYDEAFLDNGFSLIFANDEVECFISSANKSKCVSINSAKALVVPGHYEIDFSKNEKNIFIIQLKGQFLIQTYISNTAVKTSKLECHRIRKQRRHFLNLYLDMLEASKNSGSLNCLKKRTLLKYLCACMIDYISSRENSNSETTRKRESFNNLLILLNREFKDPAINTEKLSKSFGMSVQYLNALMNEFQNMSLKRMLTFLRLESSRVDLTNADLSIADLAHKYGFRCSTSYINNFKAIYDITPLQCRKKLLDKETADLDEFHKIVGFSKINPLTELKWQKILPLKFVTVSFVNTSSQKITLYYWKSRKEKAFMKLINPRGRLFMGTMHGDSWSANNEFGDLIGYYSIPDRNCQVFL